MVTQVQGDVRDALTLARLAEAELVGLVARRQESLDRLSSELPGISGWTSLVQALKESDAEAWVVACSTVDHVPVGRAILHSGKAVLLEKPVADNLAEAVAGSLINREFTPPPSSARDPHST